MKYMVELLYTMFGFTVLIYLGEWFKNLLEDIRNENP